MVYVKPCPFCGGKTTTVYVRPSYVAGRYVRDECDDCGSPSGSFRSIGWTCFECGITEFSGRTFEELQVIAEKDKNYDEYRREPAAGEYDVVDGRRIPRVPAGGWFTR